MLFELERVESRRQDLEGLGEQTKAEPLRKPGGLPDAD